MEPIDNGPPTPPPLSRPSASTALSLQHTMETEGNSLANAGHATSANSSLMKTTVYVPIFDDRPEPRWYFFYGTLTKPHILRHALDLEEEPQFRPARIVWYELASWGQYLALIDNINGNEVTGQAYLVQTREQEAQLARYETDAYKEHCCIIKFTDDKDPGEVYGNTFMYAGDAEALKEGRFDRKLWQIRTGLPLPVAWGGQKQRDPPEDAGGDGTDERS